MSEFSLNDRALRLVENLVANAGQLGVRVSTGESGERLIDAGVQARGSLAAGLEIARISTAGLAEVGIESSALTPRWPWRVVIRSSSPVLACLASQYAGWRLNVPDGSGPFEALGSGPARALAAKEPIFRQLDHHEASDKAVLIVETDRIPPRPVLADVASDCGLAVANLTVIVTPTVSLAGSVQVAARVLEVALSKAHQAGFPLQRIVDGLGSAPVPPPHPAHAEAMGRTNDAIIFGGQVHLFVRGPAPEARRLAEHLPSSSSRDYGEPFKTIFQRVGGRFYDIDPHLFSPAEVLVTALDGGETYRGGALDPRRLGASLD